MRSKPLAELCAGREWISEKGLKLHNQPVVPDAAASVFGDPIVRMLNLSDEDVMEQLRQGHPDALPILFDRFYRLVLKVALRILRDPGEAEDLMQDVFFEIFNKASQFDPAKGSTKTWILQYAYHRSLNRRQYLTLRNFYDRHQMTELAVSESNSPDGSWRGLTFQEWTRVIQQGLATLNEHQRKTLELACFNGLLLSEIAARTKESLPNVRHHYYRGLEGLRKFLQAQPGSEEQHRKFNRGDNDVES
jgi:RNA polymerase sigma-70 factor (ECF subfamily)